MAVSPICSIPECGKPSRRRGWCQAHHSRWRRNGDPLGGGRSLPRGEPMKFYQEVVLKYEGDDCLVWPFWRDENGRGKLHYNGWDQIVSRVACEEVHGSPPTPEHQAAHSCGKGHLGCCTKGHLSWKTPAENSADKLIHGTHTRGESHPVSKLTEQQVIAIRAMAGKMSQRLIGEQFGISPPQVSNIQRGKSWGWLPFT